MRSRTYLQQLDYEDRREHYEKQRLSSYAGQKFHEMDKATEKQLRAAAALAEHDDWELSKVGRAAVRELKRRNLWN